MSVRTSSVVATGIVALAVIGAVTIFGGTIAALVTPPPVEAPGPAPAAQPAVPPVAPPAAPPAAGRPQPGTGGR